MFGSFQFGQPYYGQPNYAVSANISGSAELTQQPNQCSAVGTAGINVGGELIGGVSTWKRLAFWSRARPFSPWKIAVYGTAHSEQAPATCDAIGYLGTEGPAQSTQRGAEIDSSGFLLISSESVAVVLPARVYAYGVATDDREVEEIMQLLTQLID